MWMPWICSCRISLGTGGEKTDPDFLLGILSGISGLCSWNSWEISAPGIPGGFLLLKFWLIPAPDFLEILWSHSSGSTLRSAQALPLAARWECGFLLFLLLFFQLLSQPLGKKTPDPGIPRKGGICINKGVWECGTS